MSKKNKKKNNAPPPEQVREDESVTREEQQPFDIAAEVPQIDAVPPKDELAEYLGLRETVPFKNGEAFYTRFKYSDAKCTIKTGFNTFTIASGGRAIGTVPRIPLYCVWEKAHKYKGKQDYGITRKEWEKIRGELEKTVGATQDEDLFFSRNDDFIEYEEPVGDESPVEKPFPFIVQDVWALRELDILQLFLPKLRNAVKLIDGAVRQDAEENADLCRRWKKIWRYPHKIPLEESRGGLFGDRDAEKLRFHGIRTLNDIRKHTVFEIKNMFLDFPVETLPEAINAVFKEDYARRWDFRYKVWPYITGGLALVATIVIGYMYTYTLIKNTLMTLIITMLCVLWGLSALGVIRGATRAPFRRRKKRPGYYYFTLPVRNTFAAFAAVSVFAFFSIGVFYNRYDGYDDKVFYRDLGNNEIEIAGLFDEDLDQLTIAKKIDGKRVVRISSRAFHDEDGLNFVQIPDSVTEIEQGAFAGCGNLKHVVLSKNLENISRGVFYGCEKLMTVSAPAALLSVEADAFNGCSSLTALPFTSASSVESIGKNAFRGCVSLKTVNAPATLKSIDESAFRNCGELYSIVLPGVTTIGADAFRDCPALAEVKSLSALETVGAGAFRGDVALANITFPAVKTIGDSAFRSSGIDAVTFPDSLTDIGERAFFDTALSQVSVPATVEVIGRDAFSECKKLRKITLPYVGRSKESEAEYDASHAFGNDGDRTVDLTLTGATVIYSRSFAGVKSVWRVSAPRVVEIQKGAFANASNLRSFNIPEDRKSVV